MTEPTAAPQHPPVTVVIATRDRPGLLERAVRAVLDQDYPGPVECVVVYDHTDLRELAVDVPAGRTLRYVPNTHRQGLPGGRNTGVDEAAAELIAFCDDDDFWLPGKLRRQVELLAQRPDAAAASCGIRLEGPGIAKERQLDRAEVTLPDFVEDRIMEVHSSTILIRRSTWDAIGPVDEELPGGYGEDLRVAAADRRARPGGDRARGACGGRLARWLVLLRSLGDHRRGHPLPAGQAPRVGS